MSHIIAVDFRKLRADAYRRRQFEYLKEHIPYVLDRQQRLHDLHAPRAVLDNECRLVVMYIRRFARLKRWITAQKKQTAYAS